MLSKAPRIRRPKCPAAIVLTHEAHPDTKVELRCKRHTQHNGRHICYVEARRSWVSWKSPTFEDAIWAGLKSEEELNAPNAS